MDKKHAYFQKSNAYKDMRKLRDVFCHRHRTMCQTTPGTPMRTTIKQFCDDMKLETNLLEQKELNLAATELKNRADLKFLPETINSDSNKMVLVDTGGTSTGNMMFNEDFLSNVELVNLFGRFVKVLFCSFR